MLNHELPKLDVAGVTALPVCGNPTASRRPNLYELRSWIYKRRTVDGEEKKHPPIIASGVSGN